MVSFGVLLAVCGLMGWAAAGFTAKAKTAILSGSVTGGLMVLMGLLSASQGPAKAAAGRIGGTVLPALFTTVFTWRAGIAWQAVAAGQPKLYVALLLSFMAAAAAAVFVILLITRKSRS